MFQIESLFFVRGVVSPGKDEYVNWETSITDNYLMPVPTMILVLSFLMLASAVKVCPFGLLELVTCHVFPIQPALL